MGKSWVWGRILHNTNLAGFIWTSTPKTCPSESLHGFKMTEWSFLLRKVTTLCLLLHTELWNTFSTQSTFMFGASPPFPKRTSWMNFKPISWNPTNIDIPWYYIDVPTTHWCYKALSDWPGSVWGLWMVTSTHFTQCLFEKAPPESLSAPPLTWSSISHISPKS